MESKMLSVQNPVSFVNQASAMATPLSSPVSFGQPTMQMASASGGLGQMAAQASASGSSPQYSAAPMLGVPSLSGMSAGFNSSMATPTPFTQAASSAPLNQPMLSGQPSPVPVASFNTQPGSPGIGSLFSTPLMQESPMVNDNMTLAEQMMSPTLEQQEIEDIANLYLSEQGTEEQLSSFFEKYKDHKRMSDKCALDGRYFYKALAPYKGLVPSEMYIRINLGGQVEVSMPEGQSGQEFWMGQPVFDLAELAATKSEDKLPRYRLIKLIVDISDDPASNLGSVHSNLIYIDTWEDEKKIVRFEPMTPTEYTEPINKVLKAYFKKLLPDYKFMMLEEHPQLPITDACPSKGMCAAYVLKKAMMLVTGNDRPLNRDPKREEKKIMVFADAIETEYGILPEEDSDRGQYGFSITLGGPGPLVSPYYYGDDWLYTPEYYGYRPHHRFARPWGWGWTHGGGGHPGRGWGGGSHHSGGGRHERGMSGMENGTWEDIGRKLDLGWMRAKEKARVFKDRARAAWSDDANSMKKHHGSHQREMSASRLDSRAEMGHGDSEDHEARQRLAREHRAKLERNQKGWRPSANSGVYAGDKFGAGMVQTKKSYGYEMGGPEYNRHKGCGCEGCHKAPPAGQFGYWSHDEKGDRTWNPVAYRSKTESSQSMTPGMDVRTQGEMMYRPEEGCGCGMKPSTGTGAEHGRYSRAEFNQCHQQMRQENGSTLTGGVVGGLAGAAVAGPFGILPGAAIGAGAGYFAGRERGREGEAFRPSTWKRSTQDAVLGAGLGGVAGYMLGGGKGALLGAGAGGLGGYALGGGFNRRGQETGQRAKSTVAGAAIGAGIGTVVGPIGTLGGGLIGAGAGYLESRGKETGNPALTGGLIGAGAGYLMQGGLTGVILGGAAGAGAGYLLGRRGVGHRYYPYRRRYW